MSKFPKISHISDLVPHIEGNPQFRVAEQPNGTTVVCYMLQDEDTFSGDNEEFAKECRGITFDTATGNILARTLHKFQNVGESESTQPDAIPWDKITRIMPKRDGSMITPVLVNGLIQCKTKKTFTSNEALAAQAFLEGDTKRYNWCLQLLNKGYTPTFEWTSPRFPIVLTYDKDELTLLHIRDNVSGEYLTDWSPTHPLIAKCPFPIVENLRNNFKDPRELLELAKTTEGIEGWVIQTSDGQMWKVKTAWYISLHHSVTFTRWRDVARSVLADESDDLKAAFAMTGRPIEPIQQVEKQIDSFLLNLEAEIDAVVSPAKAQGLDAKTVALANKEHPHFGLIMNAFRGKENDLREWYLKNKIDEWSLEVIPTAAGSDGELS